MCLSLTDHYLKKTRKIKKLGKDIIAYGWWDEYKTIAAIKCEVLGEVKDE